MEKFSELTAVAAILLRDNIDTDAIIPSREIRAVSKQGLARGLFSGWRYRPGSNHVPDPAFVLNDERYRDARILIAGANFGCGSSREQAVWALAEYGFRALIAPSFNPIFYRNCVRNGVLPAVLAADALSRLASWVAEDPQRHRPTVDLRTGSILAGEASLPFDMDEESRSALLEGLDPIERTLKLQDRIDSFRAADRALRPWVYDLPSDPQ